MITAALNEAATLRDLLFGEAPGEPTKALAESLREHGTIRSLVPGVPGLTAVVEREVAAATDGLLAMNLGDVVAAGWKTYDALIQAARRTRDAATPEEIVALATHQIESSHHPTVEVFIDGRSIATIEIELKIVFSIAGVLAVVWRTRLTEIRSGTCTVSGSLAMQQTIITRRQRQFDLPGAIRLRRSFALLEPTPSTTPVERAVVGGARPPSTSAAWYPDPTRGYEMR